MPSAAGIIAWPGLAPHPEGGHDRETFRDSRRDPPDRLDGVNCLALTRRESVA
jgi:predicted cupin superfamily sugar epimerase